MKITTTDSAISLTIDTDQAHEIADALLRYATEQNNTYKEERLRATGDAIKAAAELTDALVRLER